MAHRCKTRRRRKARFSAIPDVFSRARLQKKAGRCRQSSLMSRIDDALASRARFEYRLMAALAFHGSFRGHRCLSIYPLFITLISLCFCASLRRHALCLSFQTGSRGRPSFCPGAAGLPPRGASRRFCFYADILSPLASPPPPIRSPHF